MKHFRDERGQILVLAALSMLLLLAFVALATDVGLLFRAKRNAQIAADAAAVAGALDYKYNGSATSAEAAGQTASTANGITNGASGAVVTVSEPPVDGPNRSSNGFVEAVVTQPNPTFFLGMFGHSLVSVSARAVAGAGTTDGCVWALGRSGVDIPISGSGSINVPTCGVYDNSSASDALDLTGSGSIEANSIGIVGSYKDSGSGSIKICNPTCTNGDPTTGIAPVASPITLTPPTIPTGTATAPSGSGSAFTCSGTSNCNVNPGTYSSITNSGTGTLTFSSGIYNVTGNIANTGSGKIVSGTGTYTFDVGGNINDSGSGAMTLGSGTYNIAGSINNSTSHVMTFGAGNYIVNGSITNAGSGGTAIGDGNVIVNGCLCDTGSGNITTGNGNYTMGTFTSSGSSSLTLGSGLYITTGNLSLTGSGGITGTNNTFYTEGSTTVSGSGSMDLEAPTSGTYNGIVFYQPANDNKSISISGSGSMTLKGIVYAPDSQLTISGSGSNNVYTDFIVDSLYLSGSGSFNSKQYQLINASALLGKIVMVE
ncbi:MAG: pilus assembly protein TadG-related protein [Acidobacteriaceae bacterium]